MAQRILVFESDNAFADQVKSGFGGLGAEVDVVADGNEGLEMAQQQPPDLILLSIELPSMNGFLVCKKIKKNAALKDVPLIILSSDANADEIFEQHKKLRTRAEDYVKKPIGFEDLLTCVQQFVSIEGGNGISAQPLEMSDATEIHSPASVDDEIDAFADDAFETLVLEDEEPQEAVAKGSPSAAPSERASRPSVEVIELEELEEEPEPEAVEAEPEEEPRATEPSIPPAGAVDDGAAAAALEDARSQIAQLEEALADAQSSASALEALQKENADLKAKVGKGGGVSSREFLDLREKLNTKDKELLDLRDQLGKRDKELFELRDQSLQLERGKADMEETAALAERRIADLEELNTRVTTERDDALRRSEDLKGRLEAAEAKAKELREEVDNQKEAAIEKVATLKAEYADRTERMKQEHSQALDQLRQDGEAATLTAVAEARSELEGQMAQRVAEVEAAREAAIDEVRREKQQAVMEAEAAKTAALDDAERAKDRALAEAKQSADSALEAKVAELTEQQRALMKEAEDEHSAEMALLGRKLSEASNQLAEDRQALETTQQERDELKGQLQSTQGVLQQTQGELDAAAKRVLDLEKEKAEHEERIAQLERAVQQLEGKLGRALEKIEGDNELLQRARKAMAIGLGLLEDQQNNPLDIDRH